MGDCIFLVPDHNTEQMVLGFFGRVNRHLSLGCGPFSFEEGDVVPHPQSDPGVYRRGYELLLHDPHQHAVVILDAEWTGSPGPEKIKADIEARVADVWAPKPFVVVVIDPELEAWFWQPNPHVEAAVGHRGEVRLRAALAAEGLWPEGCAKPPRPKEVLETILRRTGKPRSSAIYRRVAEKVSVKGCVDPAFIELRNTLRAWFPPEGAM
jgi:hypothetical protein